MSMVVCWYIDIMQLVSKCRIAFIIAILIWRQAQAGWSLAAAQIGYW